MDILNMCCPKKPKMSLDYIINWIENFQEQEWGSIIEPIVNNYIANYPWENLSVIQSLQSDVSELQQDLRSLETDVDSRLDARLEKPNMCILGNVPIWTSGNELDGTGKAIEGSAPSEDSEKLITSGAVYAGIHSYVPVGISNAGYGVSVDEDGEIHIGGNYVVIGIDGGEAEINSENIDNLNRALATPSSTPENDATKLITSKAVFDALAGKAGIYNGTLRIDSAGDNSYPIPEGGIAQTALDSFVESTEQDKMYNVLVQFANQYSFNNYYPAIVYWTISSQDATVVHIYVGDYHFNATKAERATAWDNEEFVRTKISTFLETF